ncbi:DegT/DnrJ/EryC1/StrS family aminotransferase [Lacisediminihabitans sp. FW035]
MTLVPMLDLSLQHAQVADEIREGFDRVISATSFIQGPDVAAFESQFAEYCGIEHVVGVANGTDAIELALRAAGIGPGDEVIVPANTFVATAEAVVRAGATIVFGDCDETYLLDLESLREQLSPRTRAVVAVHLYGQTADVDGIRAVIGDRDVVVVEDAAQAQGARYHGRRAGSLGDVGGTSFYPGKNLGAYGDAGAVLTNSAEFARLARTIGSHGGLRKYEHIVVGTNSRLDTLQAVVLSAKLKHLDDWNAERRAIATRYTQLLSDVAGVQTPVTLDGNEHVFHQYIVRVADRDRVVAEMNVAGVGAGIHYPLPVHLVPAFANERFPRGSFPTAESTASLILSLPIYPGLTAEQQDRVIEVLVSCR